jgi:CheY-like chemotaxis protein
VELDLKPVPPAGGDGTRLGQVFLNLLINAAQAIPVGNAAGNSIRVSTALDADDKIVVSIADTGTGMSPETIKRIFDPFFTTKPVGSGTGLGLSICHGIVQSLGGDIAVESSLGIGSVFRVLLPRGKAAPEVRPTAPKTAESGRWGRILVVDDDAMLRRAMNRMLGFRHSVRLAANAREALDALTADANFDIVLCDVMMPDISGIELFERIGRQWPELTPRVAFLTGAGCTPSVADFLASVDNPRLTKPFNANALNEFVQLLLQTGTRPVA